MAAHSRDCFSPDLALSHIVILDNKAVKMESLLLPLALSWLTQGDDELNENDARIKRINYNFISVHCTVVDL